MASKQAQQKPTASKARLRLVEASRAAVLALHSVSSLAAANGEREAARLLRTAESLARTAVQVVLDHEATSRSQPPGPAPAPSGVGASGLAMEVDEKKPKKKKKKKVKAPGDAEALVSEQDVQEGEPPLPLLSCLHLVEVALGARSKRKFHANEVLIAPRASLFRRQRERRLIRSSATSGSCKGSRLALIWSKNDARSCLETLHPKGFALWSNGLGGKSSPVFVSTKL